MPELPEVETVKRGLSRLLPGKIIVGVEHNWPKSFPNAEADVSQFLIGAKVLAVKRRAKILLIELDTNYSLLIHLKMTGQLVYVEPKAKSLKLKAEARIKKIKSDEKLKTPTTNYQLPTTSDEVRFGAGHPGDSLVGKLPDRSTRVIFHLVEESPSVSHVDAPQASGSATNSAGGRARAVRKARLFFNDQRKFGWVRLVPTAEIPNIDFFKKLGPEPLAANFTTKEFQTRLLRRPKSNIKAVLLDQTVIAGVGNIYADESLWAAKIHPETQVKNLSPAKIKTLFKELRAVMELSIEKGGSSDKNYVNAEGKKGSYLSFAKVFRKQGLPCPRHPDTLIQKTRVAGRGTHICPRCQKLKKS